MRHFPLLNLWFPLSRDTRLVHTLQLLRLLTITRSGPGQAVLDQVRLDQVRLDQVRLS